MSLGSVNQGDADRTLRFEKVVDDYLPPNFKEYMRKEELKSSRFKVYHTDKRDPTLGWVFWSPEYLESELSLSLDSFSDITLDVCGIRKVKDNIRHALQKLILNKILDSSLVQFWGATKTLDRQIKLTTMGQPFALGPSFSGFARPELCEYRMGMCRDYNNFYVDTESGEEQLGLPSRVFQHKFPEYNPNVNNYSPKEYPQGDLALRCHIEKSWAFPVFEQSTKTCVGVLEMVSIRGWFSIWDAKSFLVKMNDSFQEFDLDLKCSSGHKHYEMKFRDDNNKAGKGTRDETMQLDSPHQPPLDPSNNGHNVVTTEENIIVVTCLDEGKRNTQSVRRRIGVRIEVSLDDILKCAKKSRKEAAKQLEVSISTFKRACREYGINRWPPRNLDNISPFRHSPVVNQGQTPQLNSDLPSNQALVGVAHINPRFQDANMVTIKAKYENHMIKFRLCLSSRFVELQQEVVKRLNLEAGTYHVKYKDEEDELILISCDEDLQHCMLASRSQGNTSVVVLLEPKNPIPT